MDLRSSQRGVNDEFILLPKCANQNANTACVEGDLSACSNCKLVMYCGRDCQIAHWGQHKKICKSSLSKRNWLPEWERQVRAPAWTSGTARYNLHNTFGSDKYLWGNTPALDVLQMERNEGGQYKEEVAVLFAASGDLRNVIKTVSNISEDFTQRIDVTINDREFHVVARNFILLLFTFTSLEEVHSTPSSYMCIAESLIHLWYSAFIPSSLISFMRSKVSPLLSGVCSRAAKIDSNSVLENTWKFLGRCTLQLALKKEEWLKMEGFLNIPEGLTYESAVAIRSSIVLAPERTDYRDRWYYKDATPFMRLSKKKFREDGLLLPYGHPRSGFDMPNPTLFQVRGSWPFDDKADPLAGWPIGEVRQTVWKATNDWYGKLFAYLREQFTKFIHRIATLSLHFQLYNVDVKFLPPFLQREKYSRIEVSNISDAGYVGTRKTLALFSPLLQNPEQNPHAALITLYINAVMEVLKMSGEDSIPNEKFLRRYMPQSLDVSVLIRQGAAFYKMWDSRTLALDGDRYFESYMKLQQFDQAATDSDVAMKTTNTIVQTWPSKLKISSEESHAQEEFELLLASNLTGVERYVEWKRI